MIFVTHPPNPRPALVVETATTIDEGTVLRLKQRMLGLGCPSGLLFDATSCAILRDTYTTMDVSSFVEEERVSTEDLLRPLALAPGLNLEERVLAWLQSMAASWDATLPPETNLARPFITDIVPAISGSSVRKVA